MAARFAELSEAELSCLLDEKKRGKLKRSFKVPMKQNFLLHYVKELLKL